MTSRRTTTTSDEASEPRAPAWERRFRAPSITSFDWAPGAVERVVYVSNESGVRQVHAYDVATGERRQITDHPVGVNDAVPGLDGDSILWFEDETGDESGRWWRAAWSGGRRAPLSEDLPRGWNEGLAQRGGVLAAAISDHDGFVVYAGVEGAGVHAIDRSEESIRIGGADRGGFVDGGLSADGALLCLEHTERGDRIHPALRVVRSADGTPVGDQEDARLALASACWSPVPGDQRLVVLHELRGEFRPALWDLATGDRSDLPLDLPGVVEVVEWPEASTMLVANLHEGRHRLWRFALGSGELAAVESPPGTVGGARLRPDGEVWYLHSAGHRPPALLADSGREVFAVAEERAPAGRPFRSWHFDNPRDDRVHGFVVEPESRGPHPALMLVHGGPTHADTDHWDPEVQAYVDAGFVVALVNYRGSTGYGRAWRDALIGDIGGPELEDVNAGLADLRAHSVVDRDRAVVAGWSWGGYVTLLELGKHPDLWLCGVAGVPVGDYEAAYEDLSPLLQSYDRALLGGRPQDVPELMRDRNPINFVDRVAAPVLILAGENDSRCPIRQVIPYVERLRSRNHPHRFYTYATGHGSHDTDEVVRQQRIVLEFLSEHVPGTGTQLGSDP